jgi:hypothetical protein
MLFRVMRPLLFLVNAEALYNSGETVVRPMITPVFGTNGRAFQNSCSGDASVGIQKALVISRAKRLLQSAKQQMKSLLILISL